MSLSYSKQMNRISSSKLLEGLISYGLFTDKIPPFLSAEQFFKFAKTFNHTQFPNSNFQDPNFIAGFIKYENMRNINIPRELAIPNPIAYFNLCKCLSDNWNRLKKHFEANTKLDEFKIMINSLTDTLKILKKLIKVNLLKIFIKLLMELCQNKVLLTKTSNFSM